MLHKKANIRFSTKEVARNTKVSCKHPVSQKRKLQTNSIHIIYAYRDRRNTRAPSFWSGADGVLRLAKCIPRANLSFSGSGYCAHRASKSLGYARSLGWEGERLSTTKSTSHHMQGMSALRHGCNCKTGKTSMQRFPTFFRKTQQEFGNTHTHTDATSRKRVRATQTHIPPATPHNTSVKTREGISSNKRRCSTKRQTSAFPPKRSRETRKCHANIRFPKNGNFKPIQSTLYMCNPRTYSDRHNTRAPSFWSGADGVLRLAKCIPRANLSFSGSGYCAHRASKSPGICKITRVGGWELQILSI